MAERAEAGAARRAGRPLRDHRGGDRRHAGRVPGRGRLPLSRDPVLAGRLSVVAAALVLATSGVAIKYSALPALLLIALRSGIAAASLTLYLVSRRARRPRPRTLLVGVVGFAVTVMGFVLAHRLTTALNAIFLMSLHPLFAAVLARVALREPIDRRRAASLAVLTLGAGVMLRGGLGAGEAVAIGVSLAWGGVIVAMRGEGLRSAGEPAGPWMIAGGNLVASVAAAALLSLGMAPLPASGTIDWPVELAIVTYLGVVQLGLSFILVERGARTLPAAEVAGLLLLEPLVNPVLVFAVLGEAPSASGVAGAAVMLAALLVGLPRRRAA